MVDVVRVAALTGYFQAMEALGANPSPLLSEVGWSPKLLSQPDQMISARAAMHLLERSAEVTGCSTIALRMTPSRGLADFGATSLLIEHEPTLRDALKVLVCGRKNTYSQGYAFLGSGVRISLRTDRLPARPAMPCGAVGTRARWRRRWQDPLAPPTPIAAERGWFEVHAHPDHLLQRADMAGAADAPRYLADRPPGTAIVSGRSVPGDRKCLRPGRPDDRGSSVEVAWFVCSALFPSRRTGKLLNSRSRIGLPVGWSGEE